MDTISVLEFRELLGFESAIKVFSDKHKSQNLAPALYGTAFALMLHFISSNLISSPKTECSNQTLSFENYNLVLTTHFKKYAPVAYQSVCLMG